MYKTWVLVEVYRQISAGKFGEDTVVSASVEELNRWAGLDEDEAELTEGSMSFTVRRAIDQMIGISHNYAAYLLTRKVGSESVKQLLQENGFSKSVHARPPRTTVKEMAQFFEGIYQGKYLDATFTQKAKDDLAGNQRNDGLPKYLPSGTRVEHKTGELDSYKHDCGIVYSASGDYVICVMTKSTAPLAALERIALVSKGVYGYFASKTSSN
jgi:beta-lactamase class A